MDCATAREAISAIMDAEDPGTAMTKVEAHLADCAACREWRDAAHEVTRRARLQLARPAPGGARAAFMAVRGRAPEPRWPAAVTLTRLGLVVVAVAQCALAVPCLLFGHDHSAPEHVAHEMGAFGAALAVGFLVAAWRPGRALGMRALVGVAAVLLVVTAIADLAAGRTSLSDEAPHLLAVAGWLMICYLSSATPPAAGQARPASPAWLLARLRAPWARGERSTAAAVLAVLAVAQARQRGDDPHPDVHPAACGCAAGHCRCPGCVAPGRAAAG